MWGLGGGSEGDRYGRRTGKIIMKLRKTVYLKQRNKEKKDILYTMKTGAVGIYTVESLNQLELINSCAVECGIKVKVLI